MYSYFTGDVAIAKATRDNVEFQARANTDAVSDMSNRVLAAAPSRGTRNAGDFHGSTKPCSRIFDFSSGWRDHRRKKFRANRSVPSRRRTGGFGIVAVETCGGWSRIRSCKYRGCRLTSRARRLCSQTSAVVSEENDSLPPSPKRLNLCVELD